MGLDAELLKKYDVSADGFIDVHEFVAARRLLFLREHGDRERFSWLMEKDLWEVGEGTGGAPNFHPKPQVLNPGPQPTRS